MTEDYAQYTDAHGVRRRNTDALQAELRADKPATGTSRVEFDPSLVGSPRLAEQGNSPIRARTMLGSQQTHGNRAIQRLVGQRPQGGVADWYDFSRENKKGGFDFGGGYGVGAAETGEWWQRLGGDLPYTSGSILSWGENDDKDTRYGAKAEAGAGRLEYKGDGWSADANAFGVNGEASVGSNGATFGGGATIVGGSATFGKFDPNSNTDVSTRFGLSAGPSFGLRGHWGDSDNDGHREIGAGFDLGIFSADLKTEDPMRSGMNLMNGLGPLGGMNQAISGINDYNGPNSVNKLLGGQYLPSSEDNKTNMTEGLLGWASGSDKPVTIDNAFNDSWKKLGNWWDS